MVVYITLTTHTKLLTHEHPCHTLNRMAKLTNILPCNLDALTKRTKILEQILNIPDEYVVKSTGASNIYSTATFYTPTDTKILVIIGNDFKTIKSIHKDKGLSKCGKEYECIFWVSDGSTLMRYLCKEDITWLISDDMFRPIIGDDISSLCLNAHLNLKQNNAVIHGFDLYQMKYDDTDAGGKALNKWQESVMVSIIEHYKNDNMSLMTSLCFGEQMHHNELVNLKYKVNCDQLHNYVNGVDNGNGKQCICVAGGPSLDIDIAYLKTIQDKVFIIAASTVLKPLQTAGIKADIVTCIDMQIETIHYFEDTIDMGEIYLMETSIHANTMKYVIDNKRNVIVSAASTEHRPFLNWYSNKINNTYDNRIPAAFSIAFTNIFVALYMGFTDIYLLGLDLCFATKQTHVTGSKFNAQLATTTEGKLTYNIHANEAKHETVIPILVNGFTYDAYNNLIDHKFLSEDTFIRFRTFLEQYVTHLPTTISITNAASFGSVIANVPNKRLSLVSFPTYNKNSLTITTTKKIINLSSKIWYDLTKILIDINNTDNIYDTLKTHNTMLTLINSYDNPYKTLFIRTNNKYYLIESLKYNLNMILGAIK